MRHEAAVWKHETVARTQVRNPTSNHTDSIRSYKSSECRAQKDFERRFFFPVFRTRVSERAGCFRAVSPGVGCGWQHVTAALFEASSGVHWLPSREATWHGLAGNWITDHRCMATFGSEDSELKKFCLLIILPLYKLSNVFFLSNVICFRSCFNTRLGKWCVDWVMHIEEFFSRSISRNLFFNV